MFVIYVQRDQSHQTPPQLAINTVFWNRKKAVKEMDKFLEHAYKGSEIQRSDAFRVCHIEGKEISWWVDEIEIV